MKKSLILKIVLSIVALLIIILAITMYPKNEKEGTIKIILKNENNEIIKSDIYTFTENDTFYDIIVQNYDIVMGTGSKKGMLLKIDSLDVTTSNKKYIKILINDEYSNYGVLNIPLNDKDVITFIEEEISDIYEK